MPTVKKIHPRFESVEKKAFLLEEKSSLSNSLVTDTGEITRLVNESKLKYPDKVAEFLKQSNTAVIRVIQSGWSMNGNYYSKESLQELVNYISAQGPIQFLDHLEDGTKLDRKTEEMVSYSRYVWYDTITESVYAAVRFPREKKDTTWIYNLIQDDPEMVGVSIAAAVYITEDFEADGRKGDKIDGWAYFDSADYVLFPSAGGVAIEASDIQEKIKKAKEKTVSTPKKIDLKLKKEAVEEFLEKFYLISEEQKSFLASFKDKEAYYQIHAVLDALSEYLFGCWYSLDSEETPEEKIASISQAFEDAKIKLTSLDFWSSPAEDPEDSEDMMDAEEKKKCKTNKNKLNNLKLNNEGQKMEIKTLLELKEKFPELYLQLQKEAIAIATSEIDLENKKAIEALNAKIAEMEKEIATKTSEMETGKKNFEEVSKKLDVLETEKKVIEKKTHIQDMIKEAKLSEDVVTPTFIKTLESAQNDEEIKSLIEDRLELTKKATFETHKEGSSEKKDEGSIDDLMGRVKEAITI